MVAVSVGAGGGILFALFAISTLLLLAMERWRGFDVLIRGSVLLPPFCRLYRCCVEEKYADCCCTAQRWAVHDAVCDRQSGENALRRAVEGAFIVVWDQDLCFNGCQ